MKKLFTVLTIFLASLATLSANTIVPAEVTATKTAEFPHSFSLANTGSDTLTIEFIVVDCAGIEQTPVCLYVNSETGTMQPTKRRSGNLASVIRHTDTVAPGSTRSLHFIFGVRVPQSAVTVSVMVRNQYGQRYYICCTGSPF